MLQQSENTAAFLVISIFLQFSYVSVSTVASCFGLILGTPHLITENHEDNAVFKE